MSDTGDFTVGEAPPITEMGSELQNVIDRRWSKIRQEGR
jgi:hypothetical protein